ncbi:DNA-binding protein [Aliarcobacter butzleri]|uniref:helix-turn-helix domain-containing protein n=1 Tax=Aliarcobacter butzleri TaxID=28197 RepID=UPI0021B4EBF1|nr:DNA-binding protein [Aliarcobacter butzleri]MCT7566789.1 DNA-binding protein [Aliarcobacter butzleri]
MQLKILKTEKDYDKALNRIDELMELNPKIGTKESDELEILALLVEKYKELNWTIETLDHIEAIKHRMEEMNLKQKDLIPYIGNKSKVSELLNRKISLSLTMVRNLSKALHIPVETLVKSI